MANDVVKCSVTTGGFMAQLEGVKLHFCLFGCQLIFASEYTSAEGATWHTNHFCCWLCDVPLAGKQYTPVDGQPHCLDCYQKKYGKVINSSPLGGTRVRHWVLYGIKAEQVPPGGTWELKIY